MVLKPVSPETWQGFSGKKDGRNILDGFFFGTKSTSGNQLVISSAATKHLI